MSQKRSAQNVKFHEACDLFPDMTKKQFNKLANDIKKNGQLEPILTHKGEIIDGRQRLRACEKIGIDPIIKEWEPRNSVIAFVVSKNLRRRHLTKGQRSSLAIHLMPLLEQEAKQRMSTAGKKSSRKKNGVEPVPPLPTSTNKPAKKKLASEEAGEMVGISGRLVRERRSIDRKAPELAQHIDSGDLDVKNASKLACLPKSKRADVLKKGKEIGHAKAIKEHLKAKTKRTVIANEDTLNRSITKALKIASSLNNEIKMAMRINKKIRKPPMDKKELRGLSTTVEEVQKKIRELANHKTSKEELT